VDGRDRWKASAQSSGPEEVMRAWVREFQQETQPSAREVCAGGWRAFLPKRWRRILVVRKNRRMSKDYERMPEAQAFICMTMSRLIARRLAPRS